MPLRTTTFRLGWMVPDAAREAPFLAMSDHLLAGAGQELAQRCFGDADALADLNAAQCPAPDETVNGVLAKAQDLTRFCDRQDEGQGVNDDGRANVVHGILLCTLMIIIIGW